jgi:hypothetical protein
MLSLQVWPKVITLSGLYCNIIEESESKNVKNFQGFHCQRLPFVWAMHRRHDDRLRVKLSPMARRWTFRDRFNGKRTFQKCIRHVSLSLRTKKC